MKTPTLSSLNGLADIGLRQRRRYASDTDPRPDDLYVQKLTIRRTKNGITTELALRLLDGVDVATPRHGRGAAVKTPLAAAAGHSISC